MSESIYPLKLFLKQPVHAVLFAVGVLLSGISWGYLAYQIVPQTSAIFLHYNILFGVDAVGEWWKVFYLPLGGLFILLLNTVLGWFFYTKDKVAAQLLLGVAVLSQLFVLVASFLLVFLNV